MGRIKKIKKRIKQIGMHLVQKTIEKILERFVDQAIEQVRGHSEIRFWYLVGGVFNLWGMGMADQLGQWCVPEVVPHYIW